MISKDDHIVTAYAEPFSGPGWANAPVWVIVQDQNHQIRQECIQPSEQTRDMLTLYRVSAAINRAMTATVVAWATAKRSKRKKTA